MKKLNTFSALWLFFGCICALSCPLDVSEFKSCPTPFPAVLRHPLLSYAILCCPTLSCAVLRHPLLAYVIPCCPKSSPTGLRHPLLSYKNELNCHVEEHPVEARIWSFDVVEVTETWNKGLAGFRGRYETIVSGKKKKDIKLHLLLFCAGNDFFIRDLSVYKLRSSFFGFQKLRSLLKKH
ncbi:hypothetical protein BgiBS90_020942 [Biomphalaria glabrata]|nr:hypothetical protein BgiBS90_020942 [Biomphalaria glabrata]